MAVTVGLAGAAAVADGVVVDDAVTGVVPAGIGWLVVALGPTGANVARDRPNDRLTAARVTQEAGDSTGPAGPEPSAADISDVPATAGAGAAAICGATGITAPETDGTPTPDAGATEPAPAAPPLSDGSAPRTAAVAGTAGSLVWSLVCDCSPAPGIPAAPGAVTLTDDVGSAWLLRELSSAAAGGGAPLPARLEDDPLPAARVGFAVPLADAGAPRVGFTALLAAVSEVGESSA